MSRTFEPIATLEGHSYAYVDRDLAPNSYLYKVVQELPSGGRIESEAVEVGGASRCRDAGVCAWWECAHRRGYTGELDPFGAGAADLDPL